MGCARPDQTQRRVRGQHLARASPSYGGRVSARIPKIHRGDGGRRDAARHSSTMMRMDRPLISRPTSGYRNQAVLSWDGLEPIGVPVRNDAEASTPSDTETPSAALARTVRTPKASNAGPARSSASGPPRPDAVNIALRTFGRTFGGGRSVIKAWNVGFDTPLSTPERNRAATRTGAGTAAARSHSGGHVSLRHSSRPEEEQGRYELKGEPDRPNSKAQVIPG
jgi:hypothetical protein